MLPPFEPSERVLKFGFASWLGVSRGTLIIQGGLQGKKTLCHLSLSLGVLYSFTFLICILIIHILIIKAQSCLIKETGSIKT